MKKIIAITVCNVLIVFFAPAQVTQINSNKTLEFTHLLTNNKAILVSGVDQRLWVTDGSLAGTIQLSADIVFEDNLGSIGFLDGKFLFAGSTAATGSELYATDGTPGGTQLVKDIFPGATGSSPIGDAALLNGFIYFTAVTAGEGRELWRTDGTTAGTSFVKDIVPGTADSNDPGAYHLYSNGSYLLLMARTPAQGTELWKSDGTDAGTNLLKDINAGPNSPGVNLFYSFNNLVLFIADNGINGMETWKTDGTASGTVILKDINPGAASSTSMFFPGYFLLFNGRAYFTANDGVNGEETWSTDGTSVNTTLLKDIETGPLGSFDLLVNAVLVGNRFIFPSTDLFGTRYQLWQSDGTTGGTSLFRDFDLTVPLLFPPYTLNAGQSLYQGNKFFFMASTLTAGNELWISDGTLPNTQQVKDINSGLPDGVEQTNISFTYTTAGLYFPANNGINGSELWKSDGTLVNTTMVADIIPGAGGSEPSLFGFLVNGKILFTANNGDDPVARDLYAVDGSFNPIPVKLSEFTVTASNDDALLRWVTLQEQNSKDFTIQRSFDGQAFNDIGAVAARGNSQTRQGYSYIDEDILEAGQPVVYYRLVQSDWDGKKQYSPVVNLRIKTAGWDARLLRNPVVDNLLLQLNGTAGEVHFSIRDMSGKTVHSSKAFNPAAPCRIPLNKLAPGVYMLLVGYNNEIKTIPFVK